MPFSLFGFITIRVWKVSQETFQIFMVYIQVFHRRADSCGFPTLQWPCCFNALLEGSLSVTVDMTMTDAYQTGLHFSTGSRNWTSNVSVPCHPLCLLANQTPTVSNVSNFFQPLLSAFLHAVLHVFLLLNLSCIHLFSWNKTSVNEKFCSLVPLPFT